jgi:threonine aldolase
VTLAQKLQNGIAELGYPFMLKSPTNQIFPIFPDELIYQLEDKFACSYWDWGRTDPQHSITRIVTSWATPESSADAFLEELKKH